MVAAAAMRKGVFNLTRTGIAAELTAASEQRLPPVGGRCRIATKRGVQGSEAGAVVVGGLGSIPGAFFAGIFLGLLEQMSALFISPSYSDMIVFVTFIIILVVRQVMILRRR